MPSTIQVNQRAVDFTYVQERLNSEETIDLVKIPAGEFVMGSPDDEEGRWSDGREGPQHRVRVSEFWMGQYPVTQAQWRIVSGFTQVNRELEPDPSEFKGEMRPVEQVSWYDAVEFCDRLSQHTGRTYRLPSEAEWEYACRAGTTTPFHFGPTLSAQYSNYAASRVYGPGKEGEYRHKTVDVDYFNIANDFGLCDMHGNVDEWCLDHWHKNYDGAPDDGSTWIDGGNSNRRILRGGSWDRDPWSCRSASRLNFDPAGHLFSIGFRVILALR